MDLISILRNDPPGIHGDGSRTLSLHEGVLRYFERTIEPGWSTLETGCGASTILFAASGCTHTCITPMSEEFRRVQEYCRDKGVSTDAVSLIEGKSEDVLPGLSHEPIDLFLIDGDHSFPLPYIDWYYGNRLLKPGGIVIVDDIQLWSCRILFYFLKAEPGWTFSGKLGQRTVVFTKSAASESGDGLFGHMAQPYSIRRLAYYRWRNLIDAGIDDLKKGKIRGIGKKIFNGIRRGPPHNRRRKGDNGP